MLAGKTINPHWEDFMVDSTCKEKQWQILDPEISATPYEMLKSGAPSFHLPFNINVAAPPMVPAPSVAKLVTPP